MREIHIRNRCEHVYLLSYLFSSYVSFFLYFCFYSIDWLRLSGEKDARACVTVCVRVCVCGGAGGESKFVKAEEIQRENSNGFKDLLLLSESGSPAPYPGERLLLQKS